MNVLLLMAAILLPVAGGVAGYLLPFSKRKYRCFYLEAVVLITSCIVWGILLYAPEENIQLARFAGNLSISLEVDGLSKIFAGLVSFLWPLAMLYAFKYMKAEQHERVFFMFYVITYGVTLGIAFSGNYLTMYFFYELLTLVTVPLVMHTLTREAILASRKYFYYSLGGAAFAFLGLIFVIIYGDTTDFVFGGVLNLDKVGGRTNILLLIYVLAFFGFGVKAAVCPFNSWLPEASTAPTPVTALLHAVAVVKAGAFAIIRLTYYSFGTDFLKGTWAQWVVMAAAIFTIVYGCARALKETHFKRRLAYSTISNLSYILFGVTLMTPAGLLGALCHMVFHAVMKICAFFCAGAVIYKTERTYVHQLDGLGRQMPLTFGIFTVASLGLMGTPGFAGFISKWYLAEAAVYSDHPLAVVGIVALLISALLTAIYMMSIVVRAFFGKAPEEENVAALQDGVVLSREGAVSSESAMPAEKKLTGNDTLRGRLHMLKRENLDPGPLMLVPMGIFAVAIMFFGLRGQVLVDLLSKLLGGVV